MSEHSAKLPEEQEEREIERYKEHHVDQLLACADSKEHRPARIIQAKQNVAIL